RPGRASVALLDVDDLNDLRGGGCGGHASSSEWVLVDLTCTNIGQGSDIVNPVGIQGVWRAHEAPRVPQMGDTGLEVCARGYAVGSMRLGRVRTVSLVSLNSSCALMVPVMVISSPCATSQAQAAAVKVFATVVPASMMTSIEV